MAAVKSKDLWSLALDHQWIDPQALAEAVEEQVNQGDLDYRTRVLIRDSIQALRNRWGIDRVEAWLERSPSGRRIDSICKGPWEDDRGFSSLTERVMDITKPETIKQFLRELSGHVRKPLRLDIGGSVALMLPELLSRRTEDVDIVDEVPAEIRAQYKLLADLKTRYGLKPAHFQQHYLPSGWNSRLHYFDQYGDVRIYLVDPYDVLLSKLYSIRTKDLDDLRAVIPQLSKEIFVERLQEKTQSMLAAPDLRERAEKNWFILFGEALPA
jgi:hypothetical protein